MLILKIFSIKMYQ